MDYKDCEQTTYTSVVKQVEVVVQYKNNILNIYVASTTDKKDNYNHYDYHLKLTSKTRNLPEFKRFNNDVRARIGTGIYICSYAPGFNLPIDLAQDSYPNPWYLQRGMVNPV